MNNLRHLQRLTLTNNDVLSEESDLKDEKSVKENVEPIDVISLKVRRYENRAVHSPVYVTLNFTRDIVSGEDVEVRCINDDYLPMGKKGTDKGTCACCLRLNVPSNYAWLPDVYTFVVYYCSEPIGSFTFRYDGKRFECIAHGKSVPQSRESIINEMSIGQAKWDSFCKTPGVACVIDAAVDSAKSGLLRKWRYRSINAYTPANRCFVVYDKNFDMSELLCMHDLGEVDFEKICSNVSLKYEIDDFNTLLKTECQGIVIKNFSPLLHAQYAVMVKMILSCLEKDVEWSVVVCGTKPEVDALFATYPMLKSYFNGCEPLQYQIKSEMELVHYVSSIFNYFSYELSPDAELLIQQVIKRDSKNLGLGNNALQQINAKIMAIIKGRLNNRLFDEYDTNSADVKKRLSLVDVADLQGLSFEKRIDGFEESMSELNGLIGLKNLKEDISFAINKVRFMEMRHRAGLKSSLSMPNHMVFTGNPGTGKTTVAKMIGKVFHSMGLLSQGDVVVTERSKLVGRYIGETESNVNEVLSMARGNVLFIDEAYTLNGGEKNDFGLRVIESLLTVLAQPNPDMIVILAGYEKEMKEMMSSNPGLNGRFPHRFHFPDYNAEELSLIALQLLEELDYSLDADAVSALKMAVASVVSKKDACFSNARWVHEYVENVIVTNVAKRVSSQYGLNDCINAEVLRTVCAEDVRLNEYLSNIVKMPLRRSVGFAV
ncbi:MAG: AAA family ATPase [Muribaculaceae bacterium]